MKPTKTVKVAIVTALAVATLAIGATAAVTAGADGSSTTYFACIKSGKLTNVGTAAPTCSATETQISWGAQGAAGPTGATGAQGPVGQASVVNLPPASAFATACPEPPGVTTTSTSGPKGFLNIPSIPGESTDPNHLGQIDVLSWSLGLAGANTGQGCAASHSPTGQGASAQDMTVVKRIDKSSPPLMSAAGGNTNLGTVTLAVTKPLSNQTDGEYLDYTMTNALVTSVQWVGSGDDTPMEQVTFQFQSLTVSYKQENTDGTLGSPILTCFDVLLQSSC